VPANDDALGWLNRIRINAAKLDSVSAQEPALSSRHRRAYDRGMPRRMTIAGQIEQLIGNLAGTPICDDCITDRLNLSVRSQANVVTRELGKRDEYDRTKASCGQCGALKTAIQIKI